MSWTPAYRQLEQGRTLFSRQWSVVSGQWSVVSGLEPGTRNAKHPAIQTPICPFEGLADAYLFGGRNDHCEQG